jgi:glutaredoxin-related protein
VVLFLKGTPKEPFDGYQKEAVDILHMQKVRYTHYNVMPDPDVREILKEFSKWPSYPMLYVNGKFVGGLNFLKDAMEKGGLALIIPSTEIKISNNEKIAVMVRKSFFMAFMHGNIDFPQCTDSKRMAKVIKTLKFKREKDFSFFDLEIDVEIEMSLIKYSNLT